MYTPDTKKIGKNMPALFRNKLFSPGVYHIYQKGRDNLFVSDADYQKYLSNLKKYVPISGIKLLAYCLMPDHVHLLIYQPEGRAITTFMRRLNTAYSMYKKGSPFAGVYRAALLSGDNEALHASRHIHRNPYRVSITTVGPIQMRSVSLEHPYSSYGLYIESYIGKWIDTVLISRLVPNYQKFVEDNSIDSNRILGAKKIDI